MYCLFSLFHLPGMFIIHTLTSTLFPSKLAQWFFFFFFFFPVFLGLHPWHVQVPSYVSNGRCNCWPTPQPQQHQIPAASVTYTTARGNTRPLTHGTKSGLEPVSSWILGGFVTTEPPLELLAQWFLRYGKRKNYLGNILKWPCHINWRFGLKRPSVSVLISHPKNSNAQPRFKAFALGSKIPKLVCSQTPKKLTFFFFL